VPNVPAEHTKRVSLGDDIWRKKSSHLRTRWNLCAGGILLSLKQTLELRRESFRLSPASV
jgi:hypothetical protein